jgi:hypothetical protein
VHRIFASVAFVFALTTAASGQTALSPWFDSGGFYNKPGADLARVNNDLAACRAEAARLKVVRNTNTRVGMATAFNADGSYNPAISGAATGIASIMFAIQDANYNGGIEQIEFRDCTVALGYRHYRLGERERIRADAEPDHGFAALVSAATPAEGRLNEGESERNYFRADLVAHPFENGSPRPAPGVEAVAFDTAAATEGADGAPTATGTIVARAAAGEVLTPQPGSAIIVASASQQAGGMQVPVGGDTFRFRRVSAQGRFIELLQPTLSFALRSHYNPERRGDPTLAGQYAAPRYSTLRIPVGRYVLSDLGSLNACLGTLSFEAREGDVLYLGEFVLRPPGIPMGTLLSPVGNINTGMDNRLRADLRVGIGDNIEAARQALQADEDTKTRLVRASFQNGYRIPCDGRYIGRVANPAWPEWNAAQASAFHDALAGAVATAQ